jgi:DHA2 family methylenomycin A resistance protein-like MFS transporter
MSQTPEARVIRSDPTTAAACDGHAASIAPRSHAMAIMATGAAFFMIVLDTSIVNLALPSIREAFHANLTSLQWLVDGYALVFASLLLTAGALGDRYGARRMFMLGLALFSGASAACGLAVGMTSLQAARVIQGMGAALLLPNSLAALNHTVREGRTRSAAVAAWASAGAMGIALGPVLGGLLVQFIDWRSIFLINVVIGGLALGLAARHVASGPRLVGREVDLLGQILVVAALGAGTYALIALGHPGRASRPALASAAGALLLGGAFLVVETRHAQPMLPLDLLLKSPTGQVALVGLLHNIGVYGLIFVLSLSFQQLRAMSPLEAGLSFVPLTLALAAGTRVGARLLDRHGPRKPLLWGHGLAAVGAAALAIVGLGHGLVGPALACCAIGAGAGLTTPAMSLAALDGAERRRSGLASGLLNSARQTGGVIGVAILGALLGDPATLHGMRLAAMASMLAFLCASAVAARVGIDRARRPQPRSATGTDF